ncbi:gluconate 2-dehydrogenase subunit 3 family protein [Novosphingobium sp. KA1]|uniref:gluconate 2-dehydrogenase subunit 3 family protein n=1 Tax=Novosphingobium sp. (strain KA1) TaxID=164608 RepID=UPI001A8D7BEB|nr:gluconate 2-dehydrogenase subunit 3 family protein [Novosphingobium sp. KA1]QSR19352.1 hypothetical protein CA833_19435 [Novosphingobium sp. KA1]
MNEAASGTRIGTQRRDVLKLAGLGGLAIFGGGLLVRGAMTAEPVLAARAASPLFVSRVCDIVLPATETAGATGAGVAQFLPNAFVHGLFGGDGGTLGMLASFLDRRVPGRFFDTASPEEQLRALEALDKETFSHRRPPVSQTSAGADGPAALSEPLEQHLWRIVKDAIVCSYYTTETGGAHELHFQLIAGEDYRADVDVNQVPYLSNYWVENVF